jgi:hypothetical protein
MELELDPGTFQSLLLEWAGQTYPTKKLPLLDGLARNVNQLDHSPHTNQRNRQEKSTA